MRWQSYAKLVKYRLKRTLLSRSPSLYWKLRAFLHRPGEPELALVSLLCRDDATAVDVGAHFGIYTAAMALHAAHVHAFEPIPSLACVLAEGYAHDADVSVHAVALSSSPGSAWLRWPTAGLGRSTIEARNALTGMRDPTVRIAETCVATCTIDQFALDRVALIKIDVEGHEESVLLGARETLARSRPALIVELEERHNPGCLERVTSLLAPLGYARRQWDGTLLVDSVAPPRHNFLFLQPEHIALITNAG